MLETFIASLLLGTLAGLSAGLFGIGGGVLIVPFLSWLFKTQDFQAQQIMLIAIATSLASAIFTSAASVRTHYQLGNIVWYRTKHLSPSLLLGALGGAILANHISAELLRGFFIAYLFYTSLKMALPKNAAPASQKNRQYLDYPIGLLIGAVSALLGIGGGTMTVPYLAGSGLLMKNAVATSSVCALPITFSAAAGYIFLGWHNQQLPAGSLGYVYLPAFIGIVITSMLTAPMGAKLAHRLPAQQLKRYFAVVLVLIALKMAW